MATGSRRALDGLRVVDLGQYLAGPLAAMILADNGADVVRVDPPGGPRWKHPANALLQRGKRSVVLDLKDEDDADRARVLVARADVLIEGFRPGVMERLGLGAEEMTAANPRLVYCSLPGFAHDDPRGGLRAWEGVLGAASGHYAPGSFLTKPSPDDPPRFSPIPLASNFGAFVAVNSILAALIARERTGLGQSIEVPLFDAMFEVIGITGLKAPDPAPRWRHAAMDVHFQCADGRWIMASLQSHRHYRWFVERFFPDWPADSLGDPFRLQRDEELALEARRRIGDLISRRTSTEWEQLLDEIGVPVAIIKTGAEWLRDPQAEAIRASITLADPELGESLQAGYAITMSGTPPETRGPRHELDADREEILRELSEPVAETGDVAPARTLGRALEGISVIDLTTVVAGPTAGRILAEFGADVIKINQPGYYILGHLHACSGKRTVLLDVAKQAGKEVLQPLVERADVFIENMSGGIADRIGVGERDVRAHRADIVYCSIGTFGNEGPRRGRRGYEPFGQAATGLFLRWSEGPLPIYRFALCDFGTGELAASAILLGLYHRLRTGEGQRVESSLVQAGTYHQIPYLIDHDGGIPEAPPVGAVGFGRLDRLYRASDGWLYLAALGDGDEARVATVTGLDVLDERTLEHAFASESVDLWLRRLQEAGVAAHRLVSIEDLMEDEWVKAHRLSVVRDHAGIGPVRLTGPAPRLSRTPVHVTFPAPPPGAHTREVVREAGLDDRYAELLAAKVVADELPDEIFVLP